MSYKWIVNTGGPPSNAVCYGKQNDGDGQQWTIIAHTDNGPVGGKATATVGRYPFAGREHTAQSFSWLIADDNVVSLVKNTGTTPGNAVECGIQTNDNNMYYAAIAITEYGLIPGKARDSNCWYPYGGEEKTTSDFMWLVSK